MDMCARKHDFNLGIKTGFFRALFLICLWAPVAASAADAVAMPDKQNLTMRLYQLSAELSMIVADINVQVHSGRAQALLQGLEADIKNLAAQTKTNDATVAEELLFSWRDIKQAVAGKTFGENLMPHSLDIAIYASLLSAQTRLIHLVGRGQLPTEATPPAQKAAFLLQRVTSNYLLLTTNPVGGELAGGGGSAEETDLPKQVAVLDTLFVQLKELYANNKTAGDKIRKSEAKWNFIRSSLLNINRQSTPLVAYRYGTSAAAMLKTLGN